MGLEQTRQLVKTSRGYLDIEASSLHPSSWPIEIGIAWIEGERSEAMPV